MCVSPQSEVTSPSDAEDRTPGRLQAIWPPPKEDGEEKVGLRYTEAGEWVCLLISSTPSYLIESNLCRLGLDTQMLLFMCLFILRDRAALLCVM